MLLEVVTDRPPGVASTRIVTRCVMFPSSVYAARTAPGRTEHGHTESVRGGAAPHTGRPCGDGGSGAGRTDEALAGICTAPDGARTRWTLRSSGPGVVTAEEGAHAGRLLSG